ncbi:MAG: hypothetical protein ACTHKY_16165, partial [Ginsengibacter sp.]
MKIKFCSKSLFTVRSCFFICFIALFTFTTFNAKAGDYIAIIPKPLSMQVNNGHFVLNNSTAITTAASNAEVKQTIEW